MLPLSVESIKYRILCDRHAIIQSCENFITTVLPRNCIPFKGTRISVTRLRTPAVMPFIRTLLIPYSLHAISAKNDSGTAGSDPLFEAGAFFRIHSNQFEHLVFEFGSELQSITGSPFAGSRLTSLFLPPPVRFICPGHFARCLSIGCVHFERQSFLRQLSRSVFFRIGSHFCNDDSIQCQTYLRLCIRGLRLSPCRRIQIPFSMSVYLH
jgi:hypothetical protein